jgi:hypothetical protein
MCCCLGSLTFASSMSRVSCGDLWIGDCECYNNVFMWKEMRHRYDCLAVQNTRSEVKFQITESCGRGTERILRITQ